MIVMAAATKVIATVTTVIAAATKATVTVMTGTSPRVKPAGDGKPREKKFFRKDA